MIIPKLKRVKISSEQELKTWLAKHAGQKQTVMFVTCNKKSPEKHVSSHQVRSALREGGWSAGRSFTLVGNLEGHVASHA